MVEDKQYITANMLAREIESWKGFEYALREENRILFNKMLTECQENEDYVSARSALKESRLRLNHYSWL
jgi:hypothetical protein